MAMDEAVLKALPDLRTPLLRFYGWTEPAATFGYFQQYSAVEILTPLRPLVRRPTGGGIVPHDSDWTYSLAFPAGHSWHGLKAVESYERVHEWLRAAFAVLGVETSLAAEKLETGPGQCFAGHERHDLLWRGRKIAGAAQRRAREGLLIQGSVQPPGMGCNREDWQKSMVGTGAGSFQFFACECPVMQALEREAASLATVKYSQDGYNRKK